MRNATRTLFTLLLGVALAAAATAQRARPPIGQVQIVVKDIASKEEIAVVEPGGTITLSAGTRVRLIMSALPTGAAHGPLYPATTFSDLSKGGVRITRSNVENSNADLEVLASKTAPRVQTIGFQILDDWVPANLRNGTIHVRVAAGNAPGTLGTGGVLMGGSRAAQLTRILYEGILMRQPDPGAQGTIDSIARGGYDALVQAAVGIANSDESRARLGAVPMEQRLIALYKNLLGLSPEQADPQQWSHDLRRLNDGHVADVVADIVQSDRFRERHDLVGVRY